MPKAIRIHALGGPEVLRWEDVEIGDPGPGEVRIRHTAVGLNYVDVYVRTGLHPPAGLPLVPGTEGAGVIEAVGQEVTEFTPGQRVVCSGLGAYAEARLAPAHRVMALPEGIDERTAAAMFLKGQTAEYLLNRCYKVEAGDTILVHAAAGGVGLILCQWAKHLGCVVIGTVGSDDKAAVARANGCDHAIVYSAENFVERVREITGGAGVPVVYDAVGRDTFKGSIDCLRPRGFMVNFGAASGDIPPLDTMMLRNKGSLYYTRPTRGTYVETRKDYVASSEALFDMVTAGHLRITVNQTYALKDAARAHADLEARRTTGSTVLIP
jgi:NADPH2:quinone reductase